jgi:hypothetical protein
MSLVNLRSVATKCGLSEEEAAPSRLEGLHLDAAQANGLNGMKRGRMGYENTQSDVMLNV